MTRERVATIKLGGQRLATAGFVSRAQTGPTGFRRFETGHPQVTHFATNDVDRVANIRNELIREIDQATSKVLFCSFLFADREIASALCRAAERLRGGVYVLTALTTQQRGLAIKLEDYDSEEAYRYETRAREHESILNQISEAGVWLRSCDSVHAKFSVVDDACVIVTSANATPQAYEQNPEDGIRISMPSVAKEYARAFAYIWRTKATMESSPGRELNVTGVNLDSKVAWQPLRGNESVRPIMTMFNEEASVFTSAFALIHSAQEVLDMASYSFIGIESHALGEALCEALERGVKINLLLRSRNHLYRQRQSCAWLLRQAPDQVRCFGHHLTHTKSIVADKTSAMLWTGNLETQYGWDNGVEVGALTTDAGIARALAAYTASVMQRGKEELVLEPAISKVGGRGFSTLLDQAMTITAHERHDAEGLSARLKERACALYRQGKHFYLWLESEKVISLGPDPNKSFIRPSDVLDGEDPPPGKEVGWLGSGTIEVLC